MNANDYLIKKIASFSMNISFASSVVYDNNIYIFCTFPSTSKIYIYCILEDSWKTYMNSELLNIYSTASLLHDSKIYLYGGYKNSVETNKFIYR